MRTAPPAPALRLLAAATAVAAAWGSPDALALDCRQARSALDKAICGDPGAMAADRGMSDSFSRLKGKLDARQAAALLGNQRRWLAQRDALCAQDRAGAATCARRESEARARTLDARPLAGPGTPDPLVPVFVETAGTKATYAVEILLYRFADPKTPAETTLDADVQAIIANAPKATDDTSGAFSYSFSRTATLAYASPRLLSMRVEGYTFTGGAHSESSSDNITIDMASGRNLTFDDLIPVSRQNDVFDLCAAQVAAEMRQKLVDDGQHPDTEAEAKAGLKSLVEGSREGIEAVTPQLSHWTFGADGATVDYDIDQLAPHALGAFTCSLTYARLRPLAKPGFPLP